MWQHDKSAQGAGNWRYLKVYVPLGCVIYIIFFLIFLPSARRNTPFGTWQNPVETYRFNEDGTGWRQDGAGNRDTLAFEWRGESFHIITNGRPLEYTKIRYYVHDQGSRINLTFLRGEQVLRSEDFARVAK